MTFQPSDRPIEPRTAIIYDGECPFCSNYVHYMKLKDTVGVVELVDARCGGQFVREVIAKGYDLDEGMVFFYNGEFYHGSQAMEMIAKLSSSSNTLNKINHVIFSSKKTSRILYPCLRFFRNLTLRLLGRKKFSDRSI